MNYNDILKKAEDGLFIIGEAGVNHNGDLQTAFDLVDAASAAGCDAVKFQIWKTELVYSPDKSMKPDYQIAAANSDLSEYDLIKDLELDAEAFRTIRDYCHSQGILFFATPDEEESARTLVDLDVPLMKTASQDVTNLPFLRYLSGLDIPIIFSTGACTINELSAGIEAISSENDEIIVLHCVSSYPAPLEDLNLSVIPVLHKTFGLPVGFSDHTDGVEAACAAVALGARVFEKHLTLNRNLEGPDHQASLEPDDMKAYCDKLRSIRSAIGDGVKRVMPCEENVRLAMRRFLVAARDLPSGTVVSKDDLVRKKVVDGIAPKFEPLLIGQTTTLDIVADTPFAWDMVSRKNDAQ